MQSKRGKLSKTPHTYSAEKISTDIVHGSSRGKCNSEHTAIYGKETWKLI